MKAVPKPQQVPHVFWVLQVAKACPDQLLPACQSLFPEFLEPALAYWEERLQTPCQGAHGEATTCLMYAPSAGSQASRLSCPNLPYGNLNLDLF